MNAPTPSHSDITSWTWYQVPSTRRQIPTKHGIPCLSSAQLLCLPLAVGRWHWSETLGCPGRTVRQGITRRGLTQRGPTQQINLKQNNISAASQSQNNTEVRLCCISARNQMGGYRLDTAFHSFHLRCLGASTLNAAWGLQLLGLEDNLYEAERLLSIVISKIEPILKALDQLKFTSLDTSHYLMIPASEATSLGDPGT